MVAAETFGGRNGLRYSRRLFSVLAWVTPGGTFCHLFIYGLAAERPPALALPRLNVTGGSPVHPVEETTCYVLRVRW